jgi:RNA polymerase sigma factor (sigma-70 family)
MDQQSNLRLLDGDRAADSVEPTDDELMLLVAANHQDAFDILVRRHQKLVLGLATRFLGDRVLARDIAQDVFLSLWADRDEFQARNRFRSYLVAVTLHRCRIVARNARRRDHKLEGLAIESPGAPAHCSEELQALIEAERRRELRSKITQLPEKMREVLILRFTHDLPLDEIAALTGLRSGTVKSHLFRGVRRLQRLLGRDGA